MKYTIVYVYCKTSPCIDEFLETSNLKLAYFGASENRIPLTSLVTENKSSSFSSLCTILGVYIIFRRTKKYFVFGCIFHLVSQIISPMVPHYIQNFLLTHCFFSFYVANIFHHHASKNGKSSCLPSVHHLISIISMGHRPCHYVKNQSGDHPPG